MPAAARSQTEAGAEAFTTYFLTIANRAYISGNAQLIEPLITAKCKTCRAMTNQLNEYKRLDQRYVGDFVHPTLVTIAAFPRDGSAKTFVSSSTSGSKVLSPEGTTVKNYPAQSGNVSVFLEYNGAWRISEIQGVA